MAAQALTKCSPRRQRAHQRQIHCRYGQKEGERLAGGISRLLGFEHHVLQAARDSAGRGLQTFDLRITIHAVTAMEAAAATMASTALPPSRKIARADCEARAWGATAIPRRPRTELSIVFLQYKTRANRARQ